MDVTSSTTTAQNLLATPFSPTYDRSAVTTGIVHFGLGNFHRAHQAMYLDRLMSRGEALDWGICGVGVMPGDARMRDVMEAQDGLYTLVLKHADNTADPRVIGSIHDYLFAPDDPGAVLDVMVAPTTRIVSLTVTEGGYGDGGHIIDTAYLQLFHLAALAGIARRSADDIRDRLKAAGIEVTDTGDGPQWSLTVGEDN